MGGSFITIKCMWIALENPDTCGGDKFRTHAEESEKCPAGPSSLPKWMFEPGLRRMEILLMP
jgi:hypothetical protein